MEAAPGPAELGLLRVTAWLCSYRAGLVASLSSEPLHPASLGSGHCRLLPEPPANAAPASSQARAEPVIR